MFLNLAGNFVLVLQAELLQLIKIFFCYYFSAIYYEQNISGNLLIFYNFGFFLDVTC